MKILHLFLIASLWTGNTFATTTTEEAANNETLLSNAKTSRENLKSSTSADQTTTLGTGSSSTTTNLTDQEKQLSENYVHQGLANEVIKENCSGNMATVCSGNAGSHKFLGLDPSMVKAVAQAYATFGALAGDNVGQLSVGTKTTKTATETKSGTTDAPASTSTSGADKAADSSKTAADKKEKANDYCKYIPTVTEGIATAVQTAQAQSLNADSVSTADTAQREALLKAAKSHDSRAKMAQIQAAGWWGGAACYTINAANGNFATDTALVVKLAAATLLGAFYQSEVSANKDYASRTRAIAAQLPGKGDCNPITDNTCYCSQTTTENDTTYCLKGLHNSTIASTSYRVVCTDSSLKTDATCSCKTNNTCADTFIDSQSTDGSISLGTATSPFSSIRSLARGELVGSTLNSSSYDKTAAIAKRGLQDISSQLSDNNINLTKEQKAVADAIVSKGVPTKAAAIMASNSPSSAAVSAAMAKLSGASAGLQTASVANKASNLVDFSGGNGLGYKGNTKGGGGNTAEDLLAKLKPGAATKGAVNSKVLEFAQKAEAQAKQGNQIRKENDTPLFEIISLRYQTSGRRMLEVDSNN
jgi:hypothetical protein